MTKDILLVTYISKFTDSLWQYHAAEAGSLKVLFLMRSSKPFEAIAKPFEAIAKPFEAIAKPFVIPECLYREYGFSGS
ncbi:MAG: hypothetical protein ACYDH8_11015 [Syntrophales bacterium]